MMAVILAGGKGTRLHPYTMVLPKPLLPLGDVPILEVVIRQLAAAGFRRVALTLGHMSHLFVAAIGEGRRWGVDIEFVYEDTPLGTAGAVRMIENLDEDFLVMNGDILTTLDYGALLEAHRSAGAWATLSVSRREVRVDYGVVEYGADRLLRNYTEKPVIQYGVSMGVNILSRRSVESIPPTGRFDMPDLMTALYRQGRPVLCYETECYWQDIGRFDDYQQASADFTADASRFLGKDPLTDRS